MKLTLKHFETPLTMPNGTEVGWVRQESPYLDQCWNALFAELHRRRMSPDLASEHHGEVWQYMGSVFRDGKLLHHHFRHRYHPETNDRIDIRAGEATETDEVAH